MSLFRQQRWKNAFASSRRRRDDRDRLRWANFENISETIPKKSNSLFLLLLLPIERDGAPLTPLHSTPLFSHLNQPYRHHHDIAVLECGSSSPVITESNPHIYRRPLLSLWFYGRRSRKSSTDIHLNEGGFMKEDNCSVALSSLFNVSSKMPVLKRCSRMNLLSERARDQARDTVHKVCESPSALFSPTPRARQNRVAALVALQLANRHATLLLARSPDTVNCALRLRRRRAWNSLLLRCFGLSSSSSSVGHSAPVADKEERERESDQTSGESSANKSERPSLYSLLQYFPSSLSLGCSLPPSFLPPSRPMEKKMPPPLLLEMLIFRLHFTADPLLLLLFFRS